MKVSVIIPVYNKEKYIENCLQSLKRQTFKNLEIIVVDDGSKDSSKLKIKSSKLKFKIQNLRILSQEHLGAAKARNLGAQHAKGEILVFVDADMEFERDFVKNLVAPIAKGRTKGTFSKEEYVANWDNAWARYWNYNQGLKDKGRISKDYSKTAPVFRAILKKEFEKVDGFDSTGYMDDWTLSQKLGYKASLAKKAVYYHYNPASLKEVFTQALWIGKRRYKLGQLGKFLNLISVTLPFSLIRGIAGFLKYKEPSFVVFKIVYDEGVFWGNLISLVGRLSY